MSPGALAAERNVLFVVHCSLLLVLNADVRTVLTCILYLQVVMYYGSPVPSKHDTYSLQPYMVSSLSFGILVDSNVCVASVKASEVHIKLWSHAQHLMGV